MKKLVVYFTTILFYAIPSYSQEFANEIYHSFDKYKEQSIKYKRFTQEKILPLIQQRVDHPEYTVSKVGESIEGRPLHLISIGSGETNVLLWSQMHGDEPTATMAIFDILNFFEGSEFELEKKEILEKLTIHFLPMMNPDGAEDFERRNALGVDVNRDALHLQSPESKILKAVRDSLQADFGFNLHDQSTYYNVSGTAKTATISFLAPAYNKEKDINDVREKSMKLIAYMNRVIQQHAPGHVGKYDDSFEPRAFGDNMQKWGTSTILIESGGYLDDPEKQFIRKLNYTALLTSFYAIAKGDYLAISQDEYFQIPDNDRKLFDLKLTNLNYQLGGENYLIDLGINHREIGTEDIEKGYNYRGTIADMGDLSTYYGYEEIDMKGYTIVPAKLYPKTITSENMYQNLDKEDLLHQGFGYLKFADGITITDISPFQKLWENQHLVTDISIGSNPVFFLEKNGNLHYVLSNGVLVALER